MSPETRCTECGRELPTAPYRAVVVAHVRADGSKCKLGAVNIYNAMSGASPGFRLWFMENDCMWDLPETPLERVLKSFSGTLTAMGVQPGDYLK